MLDRGGWTIRMRRLGIIGLFLILGSTAQPGAAQEVQVCALDGRNDNPLAGAQVRLSADGINLSVTTGADGCAWLTGAFPVSNEVSENTLSGLEVGAIYPNPAGGPAWLPVTAGRPQVARLQVFDVLGRAASLAEEVVLDLGVQALPLPEADLARGVYFLRLETAEGITVRSFVRGEGGAGRGPVAPFARAGAHTMMDETVRIEVERNGYVTAVQERTLRNFESIKATLLRITDQAIPLIDMKGWAYHGFEGGLYPGGSNEMPEAHFLAGLAAAKRIQPRDTNGNPDPNGVYILTSIGMSNTSDEFCGVADPNNPCKNGTFMNRVSLDPEVNKTTFVAIDGADPGKTAEKWVEPGLSDYRRILEEELTPFGYSEKQVQIAWIKLANAPPSGELPDANADAFRLQEQFGQIARSMKERYPNLQMIFFSSRIYAGYATTDRNPEPYAYEQGFAVKWTVAAQIRQMETGEIDPISGDLNYETTTPWIGWGPYYWADGTNPRSDGLTWAREDLKPDGVHPAKPGIEKVSGILLEFFKTSPLSSCWFLAGQECN